MNVKARILASGKVARLIYTLVKDYAPEEKVELGNHIRKIYGINSKVGFAFYEEDGNELVNLVALVDTVADGEYYVSEEGIVLEIVK